MEYIHYAVGIVCIWLGIYCIDVAKWKLKKGNGSYHYLILSVVLVIVGVVLIIFFFIKQYDSIANINCGINLF